MNDCWLCGGLSFTHQEAGLHLDGTLVYCISSSVFCVLFWVFLVQLFSIFSWIKLVAKWSTELVVERSPPPHSLNLDSPSLLWNCSLDHLCVLSVIVGKRLIDFCFGLNSFKATSFAKDQDGWVIIYLYDINSSFTESSVLLYNAAKRINNVWVGIVVYGIVSFS